MSERTEALLAINARQADTADDALLALQLADKSSLVVTSHDKTTTEGWTDATGAKHQIQTVRP